MLNEIAKTAEDRIGPESGDQEAQDPVEQVTAAFFEALYVFRERLNRRIVVIDPAVRCLSLRKGLFSVFPDLLDRAAQVDELDAEAFDCRW